MKNTCREISHTVPDSVAKNSNQQSIDGDDNGHVHPNCLGRAQAADMVTTESPGLYENMEQCKCQEKKDRYNVMQCNASVIFPVIETPKSLSKKRHVQQSQFPVPYVIPVSCLKSIAEKGPAAWFRTDLTATKSLSFRSRFCLGNCKHHFAHAQDVAPC